MLKNRQGTSTGIPNYILDSINLFKPSELKVISAICRHGSRRLSVSFLAGVTGLSSQTVTEACKALSGKQWIEISEILAPSEIKEMVVHGKRPQYWQNPGAQKCQWCKGTTAVLHEHHYPIRNVDGGIDTVSICPNCHAEYHSIESSREYKLNTENAYLMDKAQVEEWRSAQ